MRIPRDGGSVRAYHYPALDSLVWRSSESAPPIGRVLAFDAENGVLAYIDSGGRPGWMDLRLGSVRAATREKLASITSADGSSIFGVTTKNAIVRLTPSGDWTHPLKRKVRRLIPLTDGTLLVVVDDGAQSRILRMRPPDDALTDSVAIVRAQHVATTGLGDRVYFGSGGELLAVRPGALGEVAHLEAEDEILAIAPTPSGDRVFVANKGGAQLEVMDRYADEIRASVTLPGLVSELRMDPMGRYLLARPVSGDSAWVVAIATQALVATVPTAWREDLPYVAADGLIAAIRGPDVVFVDPRTGASRHSVSEGASDTWYSMLWNGFRPRAEGIDRPVSFAVTEDSTRAARRVDTSGVAGRDSLAVRDSAPRPPAPVVTDPPPAPPPARDAWTVSFAAVLSEARAREIAEGITVDGQKPRVVAGQTAGTTVYRVVFGPYSTKADAERMGRASRQNFWVYEGVP